MKPVKHIPSFARPLPPGTGLRPHNQKELAALYSISRKTLKRWLKPFEKEIGERVGYYYTIPQVQKIFAVLGLPGLMFEEGEDG